MEISSKIKSILTGKVVSVTGSCLAFFLVYVLIRDQSDVALQQQRVLREGNEYDVAEVLLYGKPFGDDRSGQEKLLHMCLELLEGSPSPVVRGASAMRIGEVARRLQRPQEATQALLEALSDKDPTVCSSVARALPIMAPTAEIAVPPLLASLKSLEARSVALKKARDPSKPVGQMDATFYALTLLDQARIDLIHAMVLISIRDSDNQAVLESLTGDPAQDIRTRVASSMGSESYDNSRALAILNTLRRDSSPGVRAAALKSARGFGTRIYLQNQKVPENDQADRKAVQSWLLEALGDPSPMVARNAAEGLAVMKPPAELALPAFIMALEAIETNTPFTGRPEEADARVFSRRSWPPDDTLVRTKCALIDALGGLGRDGRAATELLIKLGGDPAVEVRGAVAGALGEVGSPNPRALAMLCQFADVEPLWVRRKAIKALASFDQGISISFPTIQRAFQDHDFALRTEAGETLKQLLKTGQLPATFRPLEALRHGDAAERLAVVLVSAPETSQGFDELRRSLKDPDARIRSEAILKLEQCGQDHVGAALLALAELARDPDENVRERAGIVAKHIRSRKVG